MSSVIALIGKKLGMTRVFKDNGIQYPVTIIQIENNDILDFRTKNTDGYSAVRLCAGKLLDEENTSQCKRVNKPQRGVFKKNELQIRQKIKEFRLPYDVSSEEGLKFELGDYLIDQPLKFTSTSKGKGFQGVMKRYGFAGQRATHGNSKAHRLLGSTGNLVREGRVIKGKKMPGHMGNKTTSVENTIIDYDKELSIVLVKGSIPGPKNSTVYIQNSKSFQSAINECSSINGIKVIKS